MTQDMKSESNIHIFRHIKWHNVCDLPICTWLASRISLQRPPGTIYYFWHKKRNMKPNIPIFSHTWRHNVCDLPICTWLASDKASRWPIIIFDPKIEILTLTNLYLDIYEDILFTTSKSVPGWPAGSASSNLEVQYFFFDTRIEILAITTNN